MARNIRSKTEFYQLPALKDTSKGTFVAQAFFCNENNRRCTFFKTSDRRGGARPTCPMHPTEPVGWANIYNVGGVLHRHHG